MGKGATRSLGIYGEGSGDTITIIWLFGLLILILILGSCELIHAFVGGGLRVTESIHLYLYQIHLEMRNKVALKGVMRPKVVEIETWALGNRAK